MYDEKLVTENLNLVHYVIRKYFHAAPNDYDDCFQEGTIGLIKAATNYDPEIGAFSTYAVRNIHGFIARYYRDKREFIRLPRELIRVKTDIITLNADGYDGEEIAKMLGLKVEDVTTVINYTNLQSLDADVSEDIDKSNYDFVGECDDYSDMLEEELLKMVEEILQDEQEHIKELYREVIYSRLWDEPATQQYLANKYGISQPQVGRIIHKFDKKLKEKYYD